MKRRKAIHDSGWIQCSDWKDKTHLEDGRKVEKEKNIEEVTDARLGKPGIVFTSEQKRMIRKFIRRDKMKKILLVALMVMVFMMGNFAFAENDVIFKSWDEFDNTEGVIKVSFLTLNWENPADLNVLQIGLNIIHLDDTEEIKGIVFIEEEGKYLYDYGLANFCNIRRIHINLCNLTSRDARNVIQIVINDILVTGGGFGEGFSLTIDFSCLNNLR